MNIDKANNIAYVEGKAYYLVPVKNEKVFICEIDGKKYYLGPESNERMSWHDAKAWAKNVGGILMPREVALIAYKKDELRKHFHTGGVYWLDEEYDSSYAWTQTFTDGYQYRDTKTVAFSVRANFVE